MPVQQRYRVLEVRPSHETAGVQAVVLEAIYDEALKPKVDEEKLTVAQRVRLNRPVGRIEFDLEDAESVGLMRPEKEFVVSFREVEPLLSDVEDTRPQVSRFGGEPNEKPARKRPTVAAGQRTVGPKEPTRTDEDEEELDSDLLADEEDTDFESWSIGDLRSRADKLDVVVKRGRGEEGPPLKADYVRVLKREERKARAAGG